MSENQTLLIKLKYRVQKFLYFFYGEKFFKKKDMIGENFLKDLILYRI